jgi:hypothetical protein
VPHLDADFDAIQQEEEELTTNWLVFDPICGVIPSEVKERWTLQAREREEERQSLIAKERARKLPPVRHSDNNSCSDHLVDQQHQHQELTVEIEQADIEELYYQPNQQQHQQVDDQTGETLLTPMSNVSCAICLD